MAMAETPGGGSGGGGVGGYKTYLPPRRTPHLPLNTPRPRYPAIPERAPPTRTPRGTSSLPSAAPASTTSEAGGMTSTDRGDESLSN